VLTDEIAGLLARLADTPARIAAAATGRTTDQLTSAPDGDDWSALAVLAHIRASEDFVSARMIMMLVREEPQLLAFDERRWGDVMGYAEVEFHELLAGFTMKRTELIRTLRRVAPQDWQRAGVHESRGRITMLETLRLLVDHEAEHCLQLESVFD
jgi:hypothetical protein